MGMTRVRFGVFAPAVALHVAAAGAAFIALERTPGQAAPNTLVMALVSIAAVYLTYTTERRERVAMLMEHTMREATNDPALRAHGRCMCACSSEHARAACFGC